MTFRNGDDRGAARWTIRRAPPRGAAGSRSSPASRGATRRRSAPGSPRPRYALLKAQAHAIGVGRAQNATNTYWVFVVESEAHMDETTENLQTNFGFFTLYRPKPGATPMGAAADVFEWVEGALDRIRSK